jgi:hypothetical protein
MMSASPGAEVSFELMATNTEAQDTNDNTDIDSKARRQADFNFSSLWRKPKLSRRLLRSSTDHIDHVKLNSPEVCDIVATSKRSNDRNVKDRESFETMGSPHLSELDESRDVIPVIMKREGWNFTREFPECYDENRSRSSSDKLRKNMNPKMFLTPSPTKSHGTRGHHQGSTLGNSADNQDLDEVFTLIRSNGCKRRLSSQSRKSNTTSWEFDGPLISPPNGLQKEETREMMQVLEVCGVEYLTGNAVLSSISDDSGDSHQIRKHAERSDISPVPRNKHDRNEPKIHNNNIVESSFSARLNFFQAKGAEGSNTSFSFQKKRLPSNVTSTKTSTTGDCKCQEDTVSHSQAISSPLSEHIATVGENVLHQKKNLDIAANEIMHKQPGNQANSFAMKAPPRSYQETSLIIPALSVSSSVLPLDNEDRSQRAALSVSSSVMPFDNEDRSQTVSIQESAKRFGVVLGQRRGQKTQKPLSSLRPVSPKLNGMKSLPTSQDEKKNCEADFVGELGQQSNNPLSQEDFVGSAIFSTIPTVSPKKQSTSMSVLERRKLFEEKIANSSARCEPPQPPQDKTVSCLTSISSSRVYTCEKCGSAIKTPQIENGLTKHDLEEEIYQEIRRSLYEEESDIEDEDTIQDAEDSEDASTVVGDRRSTLKIASKEEEAVDSAQILLRSLNVNGDQAVSGLSELGEETKGKLPFMQRLKTFERENVNFGKDLPKSLHPDWVMVERQTLRQNPLMAGLNGIDNHWNSDHPSVVAIDDDFLLRDDPSDFCSASEKSRQVVCQPTDNMPYYAKKHQTLLEGHYKDPSVKSSSKNSMPRGRRNNKWTTKNNADIDEPTPQARYSATVVRSRGSGEHSVESVSRNQLKTNAESESTKENPLNVSVPGQNERVPLSGNESHIHDMHQTRSKYVSSSISDRLAAFQRPCNSVRKRKTSPRIATKRKSTERWSSSERRRSSRKSSLSLQDVIDSRKQMEERRKSSVGGTVEGSHCSDANVEMDENVRPSELLQKRTKTDESAPPSPLIHRRGFTTSVARESSSRVNTTQNLRCF